MYECYVYMYKNSRIRKHSHSEFSLKTFGSVCLRSPSKFNNLDCESMLDIKKKCKYQQFTIATSFINSYPDAMKKTINFYYFVVNCIALH